MAVMVKDLEPAKIKPPSKKKIKKIIDFILREGGKTGWLVEVTFIPDRRMKALNRRYRKKDKTTDVLSFSMGEDRVLGDILISKKQAVRNAAKYGAASKQEIFRLLVHGALHLLGFKHGAKMFKKQEDFLCRVS